MNRAARVVYFGAKTAKARAGSVDAKDVIDDEDDDDQDDDAVVLLNDAGSIFLRIAATGGRGMRSSPSSMRR